jgi:hypothetical protein
VPANYKIAIEAIANKMQERNPKAAE